MRISVGQLIDDKYEVRGVIGSGGMGVVYDALQLALDRHVALKLIRSDAVEDESDLARFEREAITLSRLAHKNVVRFYGYGQWAGLNYIAMERLAGSSLQDLIADCQPLNRSFAFGMLIQACEGISHAHDAGIVHRDLKPSNILLAPSATGDPLIKIIDFGLARLMGPLPMQKLTQTGAAVGNVLYMSPEQCMGVPADQRSDIYSLGALLHTCLTGMPPFTADSAVGVLFMHINEPVQNSQGWQTLTDREQRVIKKCLAKAPAERYTTVSALRDDLLRLSNGQEPELEGGRLPNEKRFGSSKPTLQADGTIRKSRKIIPLVAAAIVLATISGAAVINWSHQQGVANKPKLVDELGDAKEELTHLVLRHGGRDITLEERKRLDNVIQRAKLDPFVDKNMLVRGYATIVVQAHTDGDLAFVRHRAKEAVELRPHLTNRYAKLAYVGLVATYHFRCMQTNCHASVRPYLEEALKEYPDLPELQQSTLKLCLAEDDVCIGNTKVARQLIAEVTPTLKEATHRERIMNVLAECDKLDRKKSEPSAVNR